MAHFHHKGNSSEQGVFINRQGGPTDDNIRNISAEVYIAVEGESPSRNVYVENLITATGVITKLPDAVSYFSAGGTQASRGVLIAGSELAKSKIEGAFTPSAEKLARAGANLLKRIAGTHIGYNLYVRVKYEERVSGIFKDSWEKKHSKSWSQWGSGGDFNDGNFFYKEELTEKLIRKVMEWRVRLFVREGI